MRHVTIATAPCSWGVWYADGTPSGTPWELFLDQATEAGYVALELGPDGYLPTDNLKLQEELDRRSLSVCAGTACYTFDQFKSIEGFRRPLDTLCQRLNFFGAQYLVTMDESDVGLYSEKKADFSADDWRHYFQLFRDMGHYTKNEFGIEVLFHPHIKSLIETEEEIENMLDATELRLCFDTGHHAYVNGGVHPGDQRALVFLRRHAAVIPYLHFKNVDGNIRQKVLEEHLDSDTAFDMDVMGDLRDGIIDYMQLSQLLDEIDYDGIGVIEMDMPKASNQQAFSAAKRNLAYLREIGMIE